MATLKHWLYDLLGIDHVVIEVRYPYYRLRECWRDSRAAEDRLASLMLSLQAAGLRPTADFRTYYYLTK